MMFGPWVGTSSFTIQHAAPDSRDEVLSNYVASQLAIPARRRLLATQADVSRELTVREAAIEGSTGSPRAVSVVSWRAVGFRLVLGS